MRPLRALSLSALFAAAILAFAAGAHAQPARTPKIWFFPLDNTYRAFLKQSVNPDYMQLFAPDAPWARPRSALGVFVISAVVPLSMSIEDQRTISSWLRQHKIALALQTQGLEPRRDCSVGLEGYRPLEQVLQALRQIKDAGGEVAFITLDEPLWYAHSYAGKNACRTPIDELTAEIAGRLKAARTIFPNIRIGDVEPIAAFSDTERGPIFKNWFDSYKAAAGEPFAYLQADINWERKWQGSLQPVAALAHASGVAFGIIYNGNTTTADDRQWITQALDRSRQVEAIMHADQIVFESWMIHPGHVLPESDPDSFTGLMRNYLEHHNSTIGH